MRWCLRQVETAEGWAKVNGHLACTANCQGAQPIAKRQGRAGFSAAWPGSMSQGTGQGVFWQALLEDALLQLLGQLQTLLQLTAGMLYRQSTPCSPTGHKVQLSRNCCITPR